MTSTPASATSSTSWSAGVAERFNQRSGPLGLASAPDVLSAADDRGRLRVREMRAGGRRFLLAAAHSSLSRG
jgi:hypothetical protein